MALSAPRHSEHKAEALAILLIPVLLDVLFSFAELRRGDLLGLQHLALALPLVGLAVLAWRQPTTAGELILIASLPLAIGYLGGAHGQMTIGGRLATEVLFLAPPTLAGWLLLRAGHEEGSRGLITGPLRPPVPARSRNVTPPAVLRQTGIKGSP